MALDEALADVGEDKEDDSDSDEPPPGNMSYNAN